VCVQPDPEFSPKEMYDRKRASLMKNNPGGNFAVVERIYT
jgi:hypothetical protein